MTEYQDGVGEPDGLERLWTPYRLAYIRGENKPADATEGECPFCRIPSLDDEAGLVVPRVGVNFALAQLRDPRLIEKIKWEVERADVDPSRLSIEVLETVLITSRESDLSMAASSLA